MPKCDFTIVAKQLYWNDTSAWMFSCKLAVSFSEHLYKSTSERLLLYAFVSKNSISFRNLKVMIQKQLFAEVLRNTWVLWNFLEHIFLLKIFRQLSNHTECHQSFCMQSRRVTRERGGGGEVSRALFQKLEKSALICGKNCPDCGHLWVKFSFKLQVLRVSNRENRRFFPCSAFLSCVVGECLSKCPNSKKIPLP